jgi:hypothetical protein
MQLWRTLREITALTPQEKRLRDIEAWLQAKRQ